MRRDLSTMDHKCEPYATRGSFLHSLRRAPQVTEAGSGVADLPPLGTALPILVDGSQSEDQIPEAGEGLATKTSPPASSSADTVSARLKNKK